LALPLGGGSRDGGGGGALELVLDTAGDPANVTYQSLYARDVPRFSRVDPLNLLGDTRLRYAWQRDAAAAAADREAGAQSGGPRYFQGRWALQERNKKARRVRLGDERAAAAEAAAAAALAGGRQRTGGWQPQPGGGGGGMGLPLPTYVPLGAAADTARQGAPRWPGSPEGFRVQGAASGGGDGAGRRGPEQLLLERGEDVEEFVLRRTREWNVALRERPEEERLWLGFAEFQEHAARLLGRRCARARHLGHGGVLLGGGSGGGVR
jgi:hypothetical protein